MLDQPGVGRRIEPGVDDLAGQVDRERRTPLGQLLERGAGGQIDFGERSPVFGLGFLLGLVDDLLADLLGVAFGLVEHLSDFVPAVGQLRLVIGQQLPGLFVGPSGGSDLIGDPLLALPGFRIGKSGLEKFYDLALRGTGGSSQVEVNALGRVIKELRRQEGQPGLEVVTTLDLELQTLVGDRLQEQSAAAVLMDVDSGEILAMASTPGFDPNAFNKGLSREEWNLLASNPRSPLINKTIAGLYAPGSTFKMVVALAALEKGVITPRSEVF